MKFVGAGRSLGPGRNAKLAQDIRDVDFGCMLADDEFLCNLLIARAKGDQPEDLYFSRGEGLARLGDINWPGLAAGQIQQGSGIRSMHTLLDRQAQERSYQLAFAQE